MLALIAELVRESGGTALVVSHDPASAERADRVIHVRDGRISDERVAGAAGDGAIVVGRGGWLRLPEDVLRAAGIDRHATAELRGGEVVLQPTGASVSVTQARRARSTSRSRAAGRASVSETQSLADRHGARADEALRRRDALRAARRVFAPGKLTVVTGPSGSGKTTLLLLLAGLELPDEGDVLLDGVSLAGLDRAGRAELRRTTLAFVGQTDGPDAVPRGARERRARARAARASDRQARRPALAAVGLAEHADRPVAELSAGQRERAALARAVAVGPRVIVADEPTARLDGANALALGALLADVARTTGATVICATHDPLLIEQADAELSLGSS